MRDDKPRKQIRLGALRPMSLILYHSVESTCAQKVRLVLAAKEIGWEEIRLNLRKGDQFAPEYLRLNPKAVVPTLVHEGRVIRESTVINEYLEDQFPDPPLRPMDAYGRACMRLLVKIIDDDVHPAIGVLSYAIFLRHQMNERMSATELDEHFRRVADPARRERQRRAHDEGLNSPSAVYAVDTLGVRRAGRQCPRQRPVARRRRLFTGRCGCASLLLPSPCSGARASVGGAAEGPWLAESCVCT